MECVDSEGTAIREYSEGFDLSYWKDGTAINQDRFEPAKSQSKSVLLRLEGPCLGEKVDGDGLVRSILGK